MGQTHIIPFCDKDALGREIKSSKMGSFEGHLWLPYYIKCLFYNGFRAKVKWLYEGEDFQPPLNHF